MMKRVFRRNVGGVDRAIRLVVGTMVLGTGLYNHASILVIIGLMVLVSGIVGFCALYVPFGISTAQTRRTAGEPSL